MKKLFIIGLFLLVFTLVAHADKKAEAATYPAGSLLAVENVKGAAVYYVGDDGKKYIFPDSPTYFTWYENFDAVKKVPVSTLDEYPNGGTIPYRGGAGLITHPDTNRIYAVEPGGVIRWIKTAEIAANLYGANWNTMVRDVIPGFFATSYTTGTELTDKLPTGAVVKKIDEDDYYYIKDGFKKKLSAGALEKNRIHTNNVIELEDLDDYSDDTDIEDEEDELLEVHYRYKHGYHNGSNQEDGDDEEVVEDEVEEVEEADETIYGLETSFHASTRLGLFESNLTIKINNPNDTAIALSGAEVEITNVKITSLCNDTILKASTGEETIYTASLTSEGQEDMLFDTPLEIAANQDENLTFTIANYCGISSNASIDFEVSALQSEAYNISTTGLPINIQFKRTDN